VSCIKSELRNFDAGGAFFYFICNIITFGLYGIYWCVKADDYLSKLFIKRGLAYRKTYAWQWYLFGSLLLVGPFIAFSCLKNRLNDLHFHVKNNNASNNQREPNHLSRFIGKNYKDILLENNLNEYIDLFERNKLTDIYIISSLSESDLEKIGIAIMGDRKLILKIFSRA
jgi:uncharacterized protein YeeX (DUF496 family)